MTEQHHEPAALSARLAALVAGAARPEGGAWLVEQVAAVTAAAGQPGDAFWMAMSAAARRLGTGALPASAVAGLGDDQAVLLASGRGLDEAGRMALLLAAAGPAAAQVRRTIISDAYLRGEFREKQAVLRVISLLPDPEQLVDVGVEACRSSVQTVFEAIACENPLPADHFSEPAFNQMVLKALFTGARVSRIDGLGRRVGVDLERMIDGYADERRAAGRSIPEDIQLIHQLARSAS